MAKITDPDQLNQATEIIFDTTNKTIELVVAGNLSTDGVSLQAVYSFSKEEWRTDANLIKFAFPFEAITPTQFELKNDWDWKDDTTRYLVRDGGWAVKNSSGVSLEEWAGVVTLGSLGGSDQVYFQQVSNGSKVNIQLTGPVNQAVKIYGDASHGNFDRRSYMKLFVREWQKTYASASLSDIGVTTMTYQVYSFPLSNATDIKVTHTEGDIAAAPYSSMTLKYYTTNQVRSIGGNNYNFRVIVDGNGQSLEEIYEFVQFKLRQNAEINGVTPPITIGTTANSLMSFTGDSLTTTSGVFIDNFDPIDTNRVTFYDFTGVARNFPFLAGLTIFFNNNLVNDASAIYKVYFTDAGGNEFGSTSAIIVDDSSSVDMAGSVSAASIFHDFDYDTNVQGGRTAATDAEVTVVALGLSTGQYVSTTGTIARSTNNQISIVASLERNYRNA